MEIYKTTWTKIQDTKGIYLVLPGSNSVWAGSACTEKNYHWLAEIHNCGPSKRWTSPKYWNRFQGFLTK